MGELTHQIVVPDMLVRLQCLTEVEGDFVERSNMRIGVYNISDNIVVPLL